MGARRIIIVVGDAPLRDGQLAKVVRMVEQFRRGGGTVSTLDVSDQANPHLLEAKIGRKVARSMYRGAPMHDFLVIGEAGRGDAATLDGDVKLTRRLIKLIMGDQFANEMQALLDVLFDHAFRSSLPRVAGGRRHGLPARLSRTGCAPCIGGGLPRREQGARPARTTQAAARSEEFARVANELDPVIDEVRQSDLEVRATRSLEENRHRHARGDREAPGRHRA